MRPTKDEVQRALALIFDELFVDFPFVGDAERAHALALFLLPFLRDLIEGPTPLHLIEAPTPGSGKGLLAKVAYLPAVGASLKPMTEGSDDDEWRKRVTAKSARVARRRSDRQPQPPTRIGGAIVGADVGVVGGSRVGAVPDATLPNRAVWIATGNNPALSSEITRRTVRIRLDPKMEHPEDRSYFRHANLEEWVAVNRGDLVWAALTLGGHGSPPDALPGVGRWEATRRGRG